MLPHIQEEAVIKAARQYLSGATPFTEASEQIVKEVMAAHPDATTFEALLAYDGELLNRLHAVKPPGDAPVESPTEAELDGPAGDVAAGWDESMNKDVFYGTHPCASCSYFLSPVADYLKALPSVLQKKRATHTLYKMFKRVMATRSRSEVMGKEAVHYLLDALPTIGKALEPRFRNKRATMWHSIPGASHGVIGRAMHPVIIPEDEWVSGHEGATNFEGAVSVAAILQACWDHPAEVLAGETKVREQPPPEPVLKQMRQLCLMKLLGDGAPYMVMEIMCAALRYGIVQEYVVEPIVKPWLGSFEGPPVSNPKAMKQLVKQGCLLCAAL